MWVDQDDFSTTVCNYDGVKADIFAAGATLFLLSMKMSPSEEPNSKIPTTSVSQARTSATFGKFTRAILLQLCLETSSKGWSLTILPSASQSRRL